jgi:hypothetical protein
MIAQTGDKQAYISDGLKRMTVKLVTQIVKANILILMERQRF